MVDKSSGASSRERWIQKGLSGLALLFVVGVAYTLAQLTWFAITPGGGAVASTGDVEAPVRQAATKESSHQRVNIAQLQKWELFGKVGVIKKPVKKPVVQVKAPETTLQLELEGVFRSEKPEHSSAIISERGKSGTLYHIGDRVPGNAVLDAVHEDRVLLKRNGRLEALRFPKLAEGLTSTSRQSSNNSSNNNRRSRDDRSRNNRSSSFRRRTSDARANHKSKTGELLAGSRNLSPDRLVKTLSEDFQSNPNDTLDDLGVEVLPMSDGGGYKVTDNIPPALMRMAGLRRGDIIRSVNGQQLGNVMADQALYQQLLSQETVSVEVQRGTRRFTVSIPVPDL